jgi:glutaredoxin 3
VALVTELYGAEGCPYTAEMREHLLFTDVAFVEYDVEADPIARARLGELTGGTPSVPVLVEDGRITQRGWHGRSCFIGARG